MRKRCAVILTITHTDVQYFLAKTKNPTPTLLIQ